MKSYELIQKKKTHDIYHKYNNTSQKHEKLIL